MEMEGGGAVCWIIFKLLVHRDFPLWPPSQCCDEVALPFAFRYGSSTWIAHGKITSGLHWHLS